MSLSIGIGGVSRAGKTTLSYKIKDWYPSKSCTTIHMDEYVFGEGKLPKVKDSIDWEHPDSVDFDKMRDAIINARQSHDLVIVEGILIFHDNLLTSLFDKEIMIHIPRWLFRDRRNLEIRWGEEPDWYKEHTWESYLRYGQHSSSNTLKISGNEKVSPLMIDQHLYQLTPA